MKNLSKYNIDDTIAAISSPIGGAISIIRMSGNTSISILSKIFTKKSNFDSHKLYYGNIYDESTLIDEVMVGIMLAPRTFTKQDVVEIQCHGGGIAVNKILFLLIKCGARLAEPGEFTKRAFLNGRLDLAQAESVMDIISAKSELSHKTALNQLSGVFGKNLELLCDTLLKLLARIEMAIDYPEHEEAKIITFDILDNISTIILKLDVFLRDSQKGKFIREGIKTVILGEPNVGKSSLLNAMLQTERAIVTDLPGTTRDVLNETIQIDDIFLQLSDTAGIRDATDEVEQIGISRSLKEKDSADLILLIIDGSESITKENFIAGLAKFNISDWSNVVIVINKIDINRNFNLNNVSQFTENIVHTSAKNYIGIDELKAKIKQMFFGRDINLGDQVLTNIRHISLLENAKTQLENAYCELKNNTPIDLVAIDLQLAYAAMGEILGINVDESLIDKIFSEFCLGK